MIKNRHLPTQMRAFNNEFSRLVRRYEPSRVFDDLLSIIVCCMARETQEEWYFEVINRYQRNELDYFVKMLGHLMLIYENCHLTGDWYDPLGTFYEELASNSKKSGFGQFFTPPALCDLMAQFILEENEWGKEINEPCSGSGRAILAANKVAPGNYYIAQDIDPVCAKMTAINMCFHHIRGEVHCMNVIAMSKPLFSLSINYDWHKHKTPLILKIENPS